MLTKTIIRRFLLIGLAMGNIFSAVFLYQFFTGQFVSPLSVPVVKQAIVSVNPEVPTVSLPKRLIIERIGVNANLEHVGLQPDGSMGVPTNHLDGAWFELGPRPGEKGTAVIDGHFGWKDGTPAVFNSIASLEKGDIVSIEDEHGQLIKFIVHELREFGRDEDASPVFESSDDRAYLNLITCAGDWKKGESQYSKRLVVFAVRVTQP